MTIKELCNNTSECFKCPFLALCSDLPLCFNDGENIEITQSIIETAKTLQETNKLTNADWIDFLSKQFNVSRRSAKNMLYVIMSIKKKDDYNKQYYRRTRNNG